MGRLGHAYAISGRVAEAKRILGDLQSQSTQAPPKNPFLPPPPDTALDIGLVQLGLGNNQIAIEWPEKAADERTAAIIHLKCEPISSRIRGEPTYNSLLKKIGLDR